MIEPLTKIAPLIEDLGCIIEDEFLTSISFKRWLISLKLDQIWKDCLDYAINDRKFFSLGMNHEAYDSKNALTVLLNKMFKSDLDAFSIFVPELLTCYYHETKKGFKVKDLLLDMNIAGIDTEALEAIKDTFISEEDLTEKNVPVKSLPTDEGEKVRYLEKQYVELAAVSQNSRSAIDAYFEWHKCALLYLSKFISADNSDLKQLKDMDNSGNGYSLFSNFKSISTKYNLLMASAQKPSNITLNERKSPMLFISHSSKDKEFAEALVNLLEGIGFDNHNLFCSSVDGYGLDLSDDIFETLRNLFETHKLFMIFLHSPRYYESPISLNEMGAAWVMKTDFCSILTKDMEFEKLKGVVNDQKISVKVDSDDVSNRLNQLYEKLQKFFGLPQLRVSQWERKRNEFIRVVNGR